MTNQPQDSNLPKPGRKQVQLEVPASLNATYANFAMIMHSGSEVIIDFAQLLPNFPKARVQARIVLTPTNARLLYNALGENLAMYEKKYGVIQTPPTLADHLFSSIVKPKDEGEGGADDDDSPQPDETK
ncbi:MAG: DUF3467 domain-containing protein [Anaerolineae bacterium]|nr:DUF3467 domain-containing protein [Anaerolineae bacterium]